MSECPSAKDRRRPRLEPAYTRPVVPDSADGQPRERKADSRPHALRPVSVLRSYPACGDGRPAFRGLGLGAIPRHPHALGEGLWRATGPGAGALHEIQRPVPPVE